MDWSQSSLPIGFKPLIPVEAGGESLQETW
jgi:hypothetical protein